MIIRTILRISLSVSAVSVKALSALAIIYSFALIAVQKNSLGASATRMVSLSSIFTYYKASKGKSVNIIPLLLIAIALAGEN